jgi:hypothetical protein
VRDTQVIPDITTTNGKPSILLPLSFVIVVTGIKDFFEDYVSADGPLLRCFDFVLSAGPSSAGQGEK